MATTTSTATNNSKNKSWYGSITKGSTSADSDCAAKCNGDTSGSNDETQPLIEYGDDGSTTIIKTESYPEVVNEEQRELLELMDTVISSARKEEDRVSLPRITTKQVRDKRKQQDTNNHNTVRLNESIFGFVCSSFFGYPLVALLVTIGLAIGAIVGIDYQNPTTKQYLFSFLSTRKQRDMAFDMLLFPISHAWLPLRAFHVNRLEKSLQLAQEKYVQKDSAKSSP